MAYHLARRRRTAAMVLGVGALALVLTACGEDEEEDGAAPPATPRPTATATTPSPTVSPGEQQVVLEIATLEGLTYTKNTLTAPANTEVRVEYLNDTNIPHNIHFFRGDSADAPSLAMTEVVTGPNNAQTVTFTTPDPGDYFYHCDVHPQEMTGTLRVQ